MEKLDPDRQGSGPVGEPVLAGAAEGAADGGVKKAPKK
jgi:hypothetical protein